MNGSVVPLPPWLAFPSYVLLPSSPATLKVDPKMPPERLSCRGAFRIWRRIVSATQSQNQGRANSAEFGQEFDLSHNDIKSFYINDLVWLCWQSEANLTLKRNAG